MDFLTITPGENAHIIRYKNHRILADEWSFVILYNNKDLGAFYTSDENSTFNEMIMRAKECIDTLIQREPELYGQLKLNL